MLNNVRDAVIARLTAAGLSAGAAYPKRGLPTAGSVVCVSILRAEEHGGGIRYLGLRESGAADPAEVYAMLCDLTLCLDFYVSLSVTDAAGDCAELFDAAAECLNGAEGQTGLRLKSLRCGEAAPDRASGMMHLRGEAEGTALLTLTGTDTQPARFLDFVLKGELDV